MLGSLESGIVPHEDVKPAPELPTYANMPQCVLQPRNCPIRHHNSRQAALGKLGMPRIKAHQGRLSRLNTARVPVRWVYSRYWWVERQRLAFIKQVAKSFVCGF